MNKAEVLDRLHTGAFCLSQSLAHAHARHLHSVVLVAGPPMVRMYFADTDHPLWQNEPHRVGNRCEFASPMSLAVHSHRQDITLVHVLGEVINVGFLRTPELLRCDLGAFEYQSAIVQGTGGFLRKRKKRVWARGAADRVMEDTPLHLRAADLHTVFVPRGQRAAWLVVEGAFDPNYDPTCYSNADLTTFDFAGLYRPMTADLARRIEFTIAGERIGR